MTKQSNQIGIIGYGVTGRSAARFCQRQGYAVTVLDTRPAPTDFKPLDDVQYFFDTQVWPTTPPKQAVLSPGLKMDSCIVTNSLDAGVELISDVDMFFSHVNAPVIGITGTNGKSTVTSLVGEILNAAGLTAAAGGNLGTPALDLLADDVALYVLELSSFQLERSRQQPFAAAAILNLSEDHLDQHGDLTRYVAAKQRIYAQADWLVYNRQDALTRPEAGQNAVSFGLDDPPEGHWGLLAGGADEWLVRGDTKIMKAAELSLAGKHNVMNVLAASALVEPWVAAEDLPGCMQHFRGLAHRYEQVAIVAGVTYVNDSKATNVGATLAALSGLPQDNNVVLIAGGDAKGADLTALASGMQGRVKQVVALGRDADEVARVCGLADVPVSYATSMEDAVEQAARLAESGNLVLLSPACASLDMFSNYAERGERFAAAVGRLDGGQSA